jgi:hypothetical protein
MHITFSLMTSNVHNFCFLKTSYVHKFSLMMSYAHNFFFLKIACMYNIFSCNKLYYKIITLKNNGKEKIKREKKNRRLRMTCTLPVGMFLSVLVCGCLARGRRSHCFWGGTCARVGDIGPDMLCRRSIARSLRT